MTRKKGETNDEVFFVECRNRLPRPYLLVHQRLCECGLIKFVMAPIENDFTSRFPDRIMKKNVPATIYQKVDNDVLAEVMPILECDIHSPFDVYQVW